MSLFQGLAEFYPLFRRPGELARAPVMPGPVHDYFDGLKKKAGERAGYAWDTMTGTRTPEWEKYSGKGGVPKLTPPPGGGITINPTIQIGGPRKPSRNFFDAFDWGGGFA